MARKICEISSQTGYDGEIRLTIGKVMYRFFWLTRGELYEHCIRASHSVPTDPDSIGEETIHVLGASLRINEARLHLYKERCEVLYRCLVLHEASQ
jgi:hypothetical protein